jgi:hypothetical protein
MLSASKEKIVVIERIDVAKQTKPIPLFYTTNSCFAGLEANYTVILNQ